MSEPIPLLNVFEVQEADRVRHLIGFLDPILAKSRGLASHAMVGEFVPGLDGAFNPQTFQGNPEFVAAFIAYMNRRIELAPEMAEGASERPGERLFVIDPRNRDQDREPPGSDVLGSYEVDNLGLIVTDSFTYNPDHRWFCPEAGISGIFYDRRFYAALHPEYTGDALQIFQHDGDRLPEDD